jgi:PAS domain S-box-containing protein
MFEHPPAGGATGQTETNPCQQQDQHGLDHAATYGEICAMLARLCKGDTSVRLTPLPEPGPLGTVQQLLNQLAEQMQAMIDNSHEMAIGLSEHYETLNKVIAGEYNARTPEDSPNELIAKLGELINRETVTLTSTIALLQETRKEQRAQYNFLCVLLDTIPSPIFYKDTAGRYLGCNNAFETYVGMSREQLVGKTVHELWPGNLAERYELMDLELMNDSGSQTYESSVRYADGSHHDVIINKAVFRESDGKVGGIVGVLLDITERKRSERENTRLEAQLHHSRMMETFITQLGHDLKTPLTPLLALLPLLSKKLSGSDLERMVTLCLDNVVHIQRLTTRSLKLVSLSAPVAATEMENIKLASAAGYFWHSCSELVEPRGISCELSIDPAIIVRGVAAQLGELFTNLIANAARFSPDRGVIRISAQVADTTVTVSVQDNGIGLAPDHLEQIFAEYFKVDVSRHDIHTPGLGLAISKRIIFNHNGRIWAESPGLGKGTTIRFTLMRADI